MGRNSVKVGKLIARALQKKHRLLYLFQMLGAFYAGPLGRMQRKTKKTKPLTPSNALPDDCSAAASEVIRPPMDLPPANNGSFGANLAANFDGRRHGCEQNRLRIRNAAALLHVRKLIAQRADSHGGQFVGHGRHEGMIHPRARSVSHHQQTRSLRRQEQQRRNFVFIQNGKLQFADGVHVQQI